MEKMNSGIKKLSRYRRHRFAGPALLIVALITMGTTFQVASALPNSSKMETTAKSTLIEEGKRIFNLGCSTCHGLNLEGGGIAPALIGVGAASVDFQVGTGRMPLAEMSQQAMRKQPIYNEEETAALAAYVASLAPGPDIIYEAQLTYERDGNTAEGG